MCNHLWSVSSSGDYGCLRCGALVVEVWINGSLRLDVYAPIKLSPAEVHRAAREVTELLAGQVCTHAPCRRRRRDPVRRAG